MPIMTPLTPGPKVIGATVFGDVVQMRDRQDDLDVQKFTIGAFSPGPVRDAATFAFIPGAGQYSRPDRGPVLRIPGPIFRT